MSSKIVLVTGANGFVGCHVVRALLAAGAHVRGLIRRDADLRGLEGLSYEPSYGDLRDAQSLAEAARGCDEIYHVAADYRLWVRDPAPMYAANLDGTRNVIAAARTANVRRVIYTSTVGALGLGSDGIGREDSPVTLDTMVGPYKRSKFLAEQEALRAARAGLPIVIVNPSTPIGPFDFKPTPTGRIIADFLNRRLPAYIETGLNLVCVEDVARGHLLAAERGRIGEKYILGGENLTLAALLQRLSRLSDLPAPRVKIPYPIAWGFALGAEAVARALTHQPPRASLTEIRMARKKMFFDSTKAQLELGYKSGPLDEGLEHAIAFFRRVGIARAAA
jgi:dihydroflavonol-4-reductase